MSLNSSLSVFSGFMVGYLRYQHTIWSKSYDLNNRIVLVSFGSSFYIKYISMLEKIHSGLFLSLAITGIGVNDIIRYPSGSLKFHFTSFCFLW